MNVSSGLFYCYKKNNNEKNKKRNSPGGSYVKGTHFFMFIVIIIILLMTVFTFILTFSFFPYEEPAPKRSRPVIAQEMLSGSQYFGKGAE
jgi:heme/copper-type cytochrome/quinol oxidase subunit 2